jgi:hypothetical protein
MKPIRIDYPEDALSRGKSSPKTTGRGGWSGGPVPPGHGKLPLLTVAAVAAVVGAVCIYMLTVTP